MKAAAEHDRAGFTTLGVPVFFVLVYAVALGGGLPFGLLAAPAIFRLALLIVPAPSRLPLPTCPYLARHDALRAAARAARRTAQAAERAALRVGTVATPQVQQVVRSTAPPAALPTTPAPSALIVAVPAPATSADAKRIAARHLGPVSAGDLAA